MPGVRCARACGGLEPHRWNGDVQTCQVYLVQERAEGLSHARETGMIRHALSSRADEAPLGSMGARDV